MSEVLKMREAGFREAIRRAFEAGMQTARMSEQDKSALYWQNEGAQLLAMCVMMEPK